jgi:Tfp pilus assembly protein PilO
VKLQAKKTANLVIAGMLVVAVTATAFWILALSPKREEADKLGAEIENLEASLSQHRSEAEAAEEARQSFPVEYQRLVVLGKAVPGGDETASLLVQLNHIAAATGVRFQTLQLSASSSSTEEAAATPSAGGEPVPPTEAAASLLPLGSAIGPAGLAVMPYSLTFEGDFFGIADFIRELDSLVDTRNEGVAVDGRLITVDGFSLSPSPEAGFPVLRATFSVTTYLTPPAQGATGGATPAGPEEGPATLAATRTGATP